MEMGHADDWQRRLIGFYFTETSRFPKLLLDSAPLSSAAFYYTACFCVSLFFRHVLGVNLCHYPLSTHTHTQPTHRLG